MAQTRSGSTVKLKLQLTHLLHTKKTRPGTPDRSRLPVTQPALPHRQVLHERDQRMYRGHRQGQFVHFHHSRPHIRVLENEAGPGIATTNCLHHSKSGAISLDNLTDGTTRVSSKLPKVDGTSSMRIAEHTDLHR
jgi:hypothetical protein